MKAECRLQSARTQFFTASLSVVVLNYLSIYTLHRRLYKGYKVVTKMPTASSSRSTGSSKTGKSKPYDRDLPKSFTSLKSADPAQEERGAPATLGQKSRKGKKAWRKNIDTREEEEAMEQAREEERVTG